MSCIQKIKNIIENITDEEISRFECDNIVFDDKRKAILKSFESEDFQAVPGSGKTTLLVTKLLLIAEKWDFINRGICVLSHTNVAKDEIYKKINKFGLGKQLLKKYPHFIGTIQEFVDKFLAFPVIRSMGYNIHIVDDDMCVKKLENILSHNTKEYIKRKIKKSLYDLKLNDLYYDDNKNICFRINNPFFEKHSESDSYKDLDDKKKQLLEEGYYFYDEMYVFAKFGIDHFINIARIQNRFPLVFIDEAQDNNSKQNGLLEKVFYNEGCIYQRFGDQDQAIYDFGGDDVEDNTGIFGGRLSSIRLNDSKRFSSSQIKFINLFKISGVDLRSEINDSNAQQKIIYYKQENIYGVVKQFLQLVDDKFESSENPVIKIIGHVGKNSEDRDKDRRIDSYVENYKKFRKDSKYEYLIDIFYNTKDNLDKFNKNYYAIIDFILSNFNISEYNGKKLSIKNKSLIREYLKNKDIENRFKKSVCCLIKNDLSCEKWYEFINCIRDIFKIGQNANENNLLDFKENKMAGENIITEIKNPIQAFICDNSNCLYSPQKHIKVRVDTIHGVKGETHDATLVLETNYRKCNDVSYCLENSGEESNTKKKLKRQLYVATSRARKLLCIAVEDTENNCKLLKNLDK